MVVFEKFCHSLITKAFFMRQRINQSKKSLYWASLNFVIAIMVYSDILYGTIRLPLETNSILILILEYLLAVVLTINFVANVLSYIWPRFLTPAIAVNQTQQKLLGIHPSESGFRLVTNADLTKCTTTSPSVPFQHSPLNYSRSPYSQSPYDSMTTNPPGYRPQSSQSQWTSPQFGYRDEPFSPTLTPPYNQSAYHSSFSSLDSTRFRGNRSMLSSPTSPGLSRGVSSSYLPYHAMLLLNKSPVSPHDTIADEQTLNKYIQDDMEYNSLLASSDATKRSPSFWSYNRLPTQLSSVLRHYEYQLATRPTQSLTADDTRDSSIGCNDFWEKLDISDDTRTLWTERLRQWLCTTIVSEVAKEIVSINECLVRIGCEDMKVGDVTISCLKQLAISKSLHIPTLNTLLPYLEVSTNQQYVVKRIQHLAKGGSMSDYDWNGGGHYGKPWGEHLPNDATLLVHQFCVYMDTRLPTDARYPDGKPFTNQYFLKTPSKPDLTKEDNLLLFQSKVHPPQFDVIIGNTTHIMPKGRNNLFNALLFFLHHVKTKEHGMLGRVNLGMSGINMLYIIEGSA